ncbi:MAG: flavodoxin family protein [Desulfobacterales bacterium]
MKKILIAYDSKTGRTRKMAENIAKGVRDAGLETVLRPIGEIESEKELEGFDGYIFGCPTYFKTITEEMKQFLFIAQKTDLAEKIGGSFGSYTHIGNGPKIIHDTMEFVFRMKMAGLGAFNVKEQILDSGKGEDPCRTFGKAFGEKVLG